ncbi:MAG: hypothetical protein HC888_17120 [Candidatus Competibacteraceae bacterium]|nr:hypothetical protein [Candidatus Competibacteraceae bacterium]
MRNLERMAGRMAALGVGFRPHLKTVKCLEAARLSGASAITVSTLAEAEFFADGGFTDILYAVGIIPAKLPRAAALIRRGVEQGLEKVTPFLRARLAEVLLMKRLPDLHFHRESPR